METMNEVKIPGNNKNKELVLTTNHAASSYGMPVAVDEEGNAYGPKDLVGGQFDVDPDPRLDWLTECCETMVASRANKAGMMDHHLVRKFLSL